MKRAGLAGIAAAALSAIALALVAGPSQGPGVGTIASARADNDDAAPVNEVVGRSVQGRPIVATRYGDATSDRTVLVVGVSFIAGVPSRGSVGTCWSVLTIHDRLVSVNYEFPPPTLGHNGGRGPRIAAV